MVIALLALIVLGPEKLPEAARKIGRAMSEFRRMSAGFQAEMRDALNEPVRTINTTAETVRSSVDDVIQPIVTTTSWAPPAATPAPASTLAPPTGAPLQGPNTPPPPPGAERNA